MVIHTERDQPVSERPRSLPLVSYRGRLYWVDQRLGEFRPMDPPLRFIPFDSELGQTLLRAYTAQCSGR